MKKTTRKIFPGIIIIAFITAAITFFLLLNIEKNLLNNYEKGMVWVAAADLKEGLEISNTNLEACFVQAEIDKKVIPESAIADIHDLDGYRTVLMIPEGTILSGSMFEDSSSYINELLHPVIAGCKAEDLFQTVSGILRKGDLVNIYTVNQEMDETYLLWEDVLVYQTFDGSGNLIASDDTVTPAARINVLIEEGGAEQFFNEINKGSLRMVKLWDS